MKKQHTFLLVSVLGLIAMPIMLSGCQKSNTFSTLSEEEPLRTIVVSEGTEKDSVHIEFDVPNLPDASVNQAIMEQLNETLGGLYEGDYADADSMVRFYVKLYMGEMKEMRDDFDAEMGFERSVSVKRGYETAKLVTFDVQYYEFNGGAHGGTSYNGLSFRKSDGRQMGKNVLSHYGNVDWNNIAKEGLMEYFEVKTEEELKDCLMDVEMYMIPLPQTEPSFQENGLVFTYQQYEIAAYAAGMPSFVIPYDKLNEYLNATGRKLLTKDCGLAE